LINLLVARYSVVARSHDKFSSAHDTSFVGSFFAGKLMIYINSNLL